MLSAYAKGGEWRAAVALYEEMEDDDVKIDAIAYGGAQPLAAPSSFFDHP